jgi:hypothetical protein
VWDENTIIDEIDRMEQLLEPHVDDDLFIADRDFGQEIDSVRDFVKDRERDLEQELSSPPAWEFDLRESFCFIEVGTIAGTFDTTFGNIGSPDLFSNGTGTLTGDLEEVVVAPTQLGTKSGFDPDNPANAQVQLIAQTAPDILVVMIFGTPAGSFSSGTTLSLDFGANVGLAVEFNTTTNQTRVLGFMLGGTLVLDEAALTDGAAVRGSFSGTLTQFPF